MVGLPPVLPVRVASHHSPEEWTDPHTVDAANRAVDALRPQTGESCDIEGRGQPGLRRHFCTSYIPVGWLL